MPLICKCFKWLSKLSVDIFCWGYGAPHHLKFQGPQAKFEGSLHWNTLPILQFEGGPLGPQTKFRKGPIGLSGAQGPYLRAPESPDYNHRNHVSTCPCFVEFHFHLYELYKGVKLIFHEHIWGWHPSITVYWREFYIKRNMVSGTMDSLRSYVFA